MSVWNDIRKQGNGTDIKAEDFNVFDDTVTPTRLQEMLKQGIVHFQYRKKPAKGQPEGSGSLRDAWGTKKMDVVSKVPHGGDCPPKRAGYSIYFDLEKEDWRAFADGRLEGVCKKIFTEEEFAGIYTKFLATE
jgi:hypothetical protein